MASTTFTNGVTLTEAAWFQDVNSVAYTLFGDGTNYTGVPIINKGSTGLHGTFGFTTKAYITENGTLAGFLHANTIAAGTGLSLSATLANLQVAGTVIAAASGTGLAITGVASTTDPAGGAGPAWKLGVAATVSPTSPNRTVRIDIAGTSYYLHAKTSND